MQESSMCHVWLIPYGTSELNLKYSVQKDEKREEDRQTKSEGEREKWSKEISSHLYNVG